MQADAANPLVVVLFEGFLGSQSSSTVEESVEETFRTMWMTLGRKAARLNNAPLDRVRRPAAKTKIQRGLCRKHLQTMCIQLACIL